MTNVQTQIAEFNQSALQAAIGFANLSVENAERFVNLNLESAKSAIEDSVAQTKALAAAKDVQQLTALRTQATETSFQKALAYSRKLYELSNQAQANVVQFAEEQFNVFNRNIAAAMEAGARNAPAASAEMAAAMAKSSVVTSDVAMDAFKRAANEASRATSNVVGNTQRAADTLGKGQRKG